MQATPEEAERVRVEHETKILLRLEASRSFWIAGLRDRWWIAVESKLVLWDSTVLMRHCISKDDRIPIWRHELHKVPVHQCAVALEAKLFGQKRRDVICAE